MNFTKQREEFNQSVILLTDAVLIAQAAMAHVLRDADSVLNPVAAALLQDALNRLNKRMAND